jgi:hypothetical protein
MASLRSLMDGFQRATSLWRRRQRFLAGSRFVEGVIAWPRRAANRETLLGFLGFDAASPEEEARGLKLLQESLSPAQQEQHGRFGYFDVVGGNTGKRYRIEYGFQLNVLLLDNRGRTKAVLCFAPEGNLSAGDVMLAQKLALELFETDTLKIANKFPFDYHRW